MNCTHVKFTFVRAWTRGLLIYFNVRVCVFPYYFCAQFVCVCHADSVEYMYIYVHKYIHTRVFI